ncbi:hypothetical protein ACFL1N_04170 [Thermodesulfobacteriota bacterium]
MKFKVEMVWFILKERKVMMILKNRIVYFLLIISPILVTNFICPETVKSANNTQIVIDENLKPGMPLKDAIELLGPPARVKVSDKGTVVIPYNELGLSIEVMSDGTVIEGIHLRSSFKGRFASGLKIGSDFQKILSLYKDPDIMTEDILEYFDTGRIFKLSREKLVGATLYSNKSKLFQRMSNTVTGKGERIPEKAGVEIPEEVREEVRKEVRNEVRKEVREEAREEARKEVRKEVREEVRKEVIEKGRDVVFEDDRVFELFGFKVKRTFEGVVITEIRPGSVAQHGGLKKGEPIKKASLKNYGVRNIYSVGGLEKVLEKSILRGNKTINILQKGNRYYKVEVPEIK